MLVDPARQVASENVAQANRAAKLAELDLLKQQLERVQRLLENALFFIPVRYVTVETLRERRGKMPFTAPATERSREPPPAAH